MSVKRNRKDELGNRLKSMERVETSQVFPPNTYLYVRLDGRGFSKFTKGLQRPYDERMSQLMEATTKHLFKEFNCIFSLVQSDEISLIINNSYDSGCIFEGKKQKLLSTIASSCTAYFNMYLSKYLPEKAEAILNGKCRLPTFDCRIFPLGTKDEATNAILWRENDATKNAISMAASHYFSHKELQNKTGLVMKDMLKTKANVNFESYPDFFKHGTGFKKQSVNYVSTDPNVVDYIRTKIIKTKVLKTMTHEERVKHVFDIDTRTEVVA